MRVEVWVDGSGLATGGPAGIAYVAVVDGGHPIEGSLGIPNATNQKAEILAAAFALHELDPAEQVLVWTDSEYVVKGMTEWIPTWLVNGWKTKSHKPAKNQAHWRRLIAAAEKHDVVSFRWLKGHNGQWANERADQLAGIARLDQIGSVNGIEVEGSELEEFGRLTRDR